MLEDQAVGGRLPGPAGAPCAPQAPAAGAAGLPAPDPAVADSARLRIAARRRLADGQPDGQAAARRAADIQAINAVIGSARAGAAHPPDGLDVGAALVVLCDLRLYLDGLEADLLDAAQRAGLGWDVIAAIIGIPADEAEHRHRVLRAQHGPQ
jgi:hypothetical protein